MGEMASGSMSGAPGVAPAKCNTAWRTQLDRVQEALASCTQEIARQVRLEASAELAGSLDRSARRLRSARGDDWRQALLDAVRDFCGRAALFTVRDASLHLDGARGILREHQLGDIALSAAPAFRAAIETGDTIVAMRTKGEMSETIASYFGEAPDARFHLFPVSIRENVAAVLYADGDSVQVDCLDLLVCVAGTALESRPAGTAEKTGLVNIAIASNEPAAEEWSELSEEERDLHRKAQRFGRVQVARLRLYKSDDVKTARAEGTLYKSLKEEIDAARGVFRRDFIGKSPTMVDYFHLELVRTLANDNVELLGPDYPGPMV